MHAVKFAEINQIILSEEEQQMIIDKFPEKLRPFLNNINNPLDETQILVNLFKDKGVRMFVGIQSDEFGDEDYTSYYHVVDIAKEIKCDETHTRDWAKQWKINFIAYENLPAIFSRVPIKLNFDSKVTNKKAKFINEQDLKIILLKIKSDEARIFQEWILKQSTIMKKVIKYVIKIKHQQELEIKDIENAKLKKRLEAKTLSEKDVLQLSLNAVKTFPKSERTAGTIYIATSPDYQKKYVYKIGLTTRDKKSREQTMQTSNPDINIVFVIGTVDVCLAEKYIHEYLKHLNYEKEFFYVSSLDKAKEIVNFIVNFVNECIGKYDDDYETLQKQYVDDNIKHIDKMDLVQPQLQIRGRSKSPMSVHKHAKQSNLSDISQITDSTYSSDDTETKIREFCDRYVIQTNNDADYILRTDLIHKYGEWHKNSYCTRPNTTEIVNAFTDIFFHCGPVNIPENKYFGWQQYKMNDN